MASASVANSHTQNSWVYVSPFMVIITRCSPFTRSSSPVTPKGVTLARFVSDVHTPGWISEILDSVSTKTVRGRPPIKARTLGAPFKQSNWLSWLLAASFVKYRWRALSSRPSVASFEACSVEWRPCTLLCLARRGGSLTFHWPTLNTTFGVALLSACLCRRFAQSRAKCP